MAGNDNSLVRPKTPQDQSRIAAGSPLAVQGVFLEIIRERFTEEAGLDWIWRPEITETALLIEAGFNEETEARSETPAIYINRLQSTPIKMTIGDRAGVRLRDHLEGFSALMKVVMSIECVSPDAGETAILADIVQFMLLASSDIIQREFGLLDISHPVMGQTLPFEGTQGKFSTALNFDIDFWVRWSQVPIAPLLQQISVRATATDNPDFFIRTVVNSMRRS